MCFLGNRCFRSSFLFIIPLILCAYTHLWNPIGFPAFHNDEGGYIAHGMHVLKGLGVQDLPFYDHPYFGQLFLAAVFWLIGYPSSIHPSVSDLHSIKTIYMVPRILMGLLAVVDTLLIFKISERRYNRSVALATAILFAVMPITWLTRRIFLDSIQLPFLLSSILFGMYSTKLKDNGKVVMVLLSGIFLGLAIFTKIPAFTMIPLVGFVIYNSNMSSRNRRSLVGLWFIPVVLIPVIWPAYAISIGEFHLWVAGVFLQLHRISQPLLDSVNGFFKDDPVLLLLAIAGLVFAAIKRDYFVLLWTIPFLVFPYVIGHVSLFYFIPLIPALCIASARLIIELPKIIKKKRVQQALPIVIISGITVFGLISITMILTIDLTSSQFRAAAFVAQYIPSTNDSHIENNKITMISDPFYSWIPQYVFGKNQIYKSYDNKQPAMTQRILLVIDWGFIHVMSGHDKHAEQLRSIYANTTRILSITENALKYNYNIFPYTNLREHSLEQRIEIRIRN